jgi:ATPase family associated with various cellular activities (AAA)
MTAEADWESRNNAYLAGGLAWLRGLLAGTGAGKPGGPQRAPWPDGDPGRSGAAEPEPGPALELLGDRLGMSRFERSVLLLCAAAEFDPGLAAAWADGAAGAAAGQPTFGLALSILPEPAWDALSPHRPLRYWRLVDIYQQAAQPLVASALRADERIVNYIKGLNQLDGRLAHLLRPAGDVLGPLTPSQEAAILDGLVAWDDPHPAASLPLIEILGPDPVVRQGLAWAMAARAGLLLYELAADRLPRHGPDLADLIRLWQRETLLLPLALYVDVGDARDDDAISLPDVLRDLTGAVLVGCREPLLVPGRTYCLVDGQRPDQDEQEGLWAEELAGLVEPADDLTAVSGRLSAEFDLNQAAIRQVSRHARRRGGTGALRKACQAHTRPRLESLAKRQEATAKWDDLILPDSETILLRHLVDQVRGRATVLRHWGFAENITRGSGITALFAGQSGTGKSLAAEVIAGELGLTLYRVDLSGVVSKYIGETERNLRRVFDAADQGGCVLLFDEADALFGQRSEVKDSHDRYANIEVNYLLQRMEDYRGVAILTTNRRQALDQAFLRRLRFVVHFPFPPQHERALLWQRAFPARTPVGDLDLGQLTKLAATGGMIRNIALNAAFCAAGRQTPITTELVLEMARTEFRKLRLPVSDADFRVPGKGAR